MRTEMILKRLKPALSGSIVPLGIGLCLALTIGACNNAPEQNSAKEVEAPVQEKKEGNKASIELAWETDTLFPTNESVLYLRDENLLFVSCIAGNPTEKDGLGHIAKLSTEGKVLDSAWASGFNAPKGMCVFEDRLYFTDIDRVVSIALANPKDQVTYPVAGASFLNDLSTGKRGVYISDMQTAKLHYLEAGTIHTINESLEGLNGLAYFEDRLYALSNEGLLMLSEGGEVLETINGELKGGDGLIPLGNNRFILSRWQGEIWYADGAKSSLLLDSKEAGIQTADIGYDAQSQMLYVPRFFANKVSAYKLQLPK